MSFIGLDYVAVAAYLVLQLLLAERKKPSSISPTVEARRLTLPAFVASMVATWYGAILGVGEFIYERGLFAAVAMSLPYYLFALAYAFYFVKYARRRSLRQQHGFTVADSTLSKLRLVLLVILALPGAYYWMAALLFASLGVSSKIAAILLTGALAYAILRRGRRGVYQSNAADFGVMYAGFILLVVMCFNHFGSLEHLETSLPQTHLRPQWEQHLPELGLWFFIGAQTFIDPAFQQRIQDAQCPKTAKHGLFMCILAWMVFDALAIAAGLYAKAYLPNIAEPGLSYLVLANAVMPSGLRGFFWVSVFAIIFSTLVSMAQAATQCAQDLCQDINPRYTLNPNVISAAVLGLSGLGALILPSAVSQWLLLGRFILPAALLLNFARWGLMPRMVIDSLSHIVIGTLSMIIMAGILHALNYQTWSLIIVDGVVALIFAAVFAPKIQGVGRFLLQQYKRLAAQTV